MLNWNFPGLTFNEFNLSQYNIPFVLKIRFCLTSVNHSPHEYKVLSSAKLQIADYLTIINISLINILNKIGPKIDPRGIPRKVFDYLLYLLSLEPISVLCFLKVR